MQQYLRRKSLGSPSQSVTKQGHSQSIVHCRSRDIQVEHARLFDERSPSLSTNTRQSETQIRARQPPSRDPKNDQIHFAQPAISTRQTLSTTAHEFVPDDHHLHGGDDSSGSRNYKSRQPCTQIRRISPVPARLDSCSWISLRLTIPESIHKKHLTTLSGRSDQTHTTTQCAVERYSKMWHLSERARAPNSRTTFKAKCVSATVCHHM